MSRRATKLSTEEKIATLKRVFETDIHSFAKFFFPNYMGTKTPTFHKEIYELLEDTSIEKMVIGAPRGHGKSSIFNLFYLAWAICNKKAKFILMISDTYSQSALFLETLKSELASNEKIKAFYGEMKSEKWSEDELVTKNGVMVKCIGSGMKVRGLKFRESRPDLVVGDDLENDESVENKERRDKMERWFNGALVPSLAVDARIVVIGTILHYDSLLSKLLSDKYYDEFTKRTYRAIQENGKAIWKEHLSVAKLEEIKKNYLRNGMGYVFYQEYQNDPVSDENRKFKIETFRYYEDKEIERKTLNTFIAIDRAYSLKKTADFTGIVVVSVDKENMWYIRLAERLKGTEGEIIEKIFNLKEYFKPNVVGIEQKAFEYTLKPTLESEMRRRNVFFKVTELKDAGNSKIKRIEGLVPRFESGSIFLKQGMDDLQDELTRFPSAPHDDVADALSYILKLAFPPKMQTDNQVYIPTISTYF